MGRAVLELAAPTSMNASPARATRGASMARHKAKKALEADLARLLLAAGVPRPIPGDRVRASAELVFSAERRRDEGNYRTALEKALGDALSPHDPDSPFRWLSDDTPEHFTFGRVTFRVEPLRRGLSRSTAYLTLVWGGDLVEELQREASDLAAALTADDYAALRAGVLEGTG